ncbi:hypothetical protein [Methylobacterium sp. Leaf117]|uniref:hypothetical protein n=1 Tax=Methylobacterium sp. Leaf117 TaxID=1736260 RepID=UPI0006F4290F|nr:hypothetical protein [Methylobacterium sp. Leaf117]KQP80283.1 hypothetical protein ASF57_18015 [Methylobacterium sp. Leaf117]
MAAAVTVSAMMAAKAVPRGAEANAPISTEVSVMMAEAAASVTVEASMMAVEAMITPEGTRLA